MRKESKNKTAKRGFLAWVVEHVSPSVTFSQPGSEECSSGNNESPPNIGTGSFGQWLDYAKEKAMFVIKFRFRF